MLAAWIFCQIGTPQKWLGDCEKKNACFSVGISYSKKVGFFGTPTFTTLTDFTKKSPRLEIEDDDVSDPVSDKVPAQEPEPAMAAPRQFAPLPEGFTQNAYEVGLEASQTVMFLDVVHVDERRFVGFSGFCVAKKGSFKRRCAIDDDLDMWNSRPPTLTVAS